MRENAGTMIQIRRSADRGHANHGWLDSHHSFSFADYQDPRFMGFRSLRVINEDRVQPGKGFGTHSHRDMEILTCVLDGVLEHKDSLGTSAQIRPGELQRMSAGTGVTHSEYNPSRDAPVHFLQIWILPERLGLEPSYEQRAFPAGDLGDHLRLVASRDGREGSLTVHQDVSLQLGALGRGARIRQPLVAGRHAWLQIARGRVRLGRETLAAGDGASLSDEASVELEALEDSELLLFDLA
jgi:redox-sensitive bicupin YhaK (pirin superfamily)